MRTKDQIKNELYQRFSSFFNETFIENMAMMVEENEKLKARVAELEAELNAKGEKPN